VNNCNNTLFIKLWVSIVAPITAEKRLSASDKFKGTVINDYNIKYNEEINLSVVSVDLHTGRHHQIRVQFASRNHSLCGDQKYGTRGRGKQLALWAYSLSILHPITKERMEFNIEPEHIGSWKILD